MSTSKHIDKICCIKSRNILVAVFLKVSLYSSRILSIGIIDNVRFFSGHCIRIQFLLYRLLTGLILLLV